MTAKVTTLKIQLTVSALGRVTRAAGKRDVEAFARSTLLRAVRDLEKAKRAARHILRVSPDRMFPGRHNVECDCNWAMGNFDTPDEAWKQGNAHIDFRTRQRA